MPVTFVVTPHPAEPLKYYKNSVKNSPTAFFKASCPGPANSLKELLSTSAKPDDFATVIPRHNGFVSTCIEAYNTHHHLTIRPDDIWITILSQLNLYVNANAERLRKSLVSHDGVKLLVLVFPDSNASRHTVNPAEMAQGFADLLKKHVTDPELYDFVMPDFTTTTVIDTTICSVMMMATLKRYFAYAAICGCGLPSVTLEGERADYERLEARLDKLATFGDEPGRWAEMLRPIIRRFVRAFDGEPDADFWTKIFTKTGNASGPFYYSGWITAFCPFNNDGAWQLQEISPIPPSPLEQLGEWRYNMLMKRAKSGQGLQAKDYYPPYLELDGVAYGSMPTNISVTTFCQVDVTFFELSEGGRKVDVSVVAGLVGATVSSFGEGQDNAMAPYPAWFMFEKVEEEKAEDSLVEKPNNVTGWRRTSNPTLAGPIEVGLRKTEKLARIR